MNEYQYFSLSVEATRHKVRAYKVLVQSIPAVKIQGSFLEKDSPEKSITIERPTLIIVPRFGNYFLLPTGERGQANSVLRLIPDGQNVITLSPR